MSLVRRPPTSRRPSLAPRRPAASRPPTSRRPLAGGRLLAACAVLLFAVAGPLLSSPARTAALAIRMGLVSQTPFSVPIDGTVTFVVSMPSTIDLAAYPDATLVVTAYKAVTTRDAVSRAQHGELPRTADSLDLPIAALARPDAGQLQAVVPLESTTRTLTALQLSKPGIYPVMLELTDNGDVLAELLTFVHRLPGPDDEPEAALPVATAMATTSAVTFDDRQQIVLDNRIITELTQLADLLDAATVPVAVKVPPALLTALAEHGADGAALAERLNAGLAKNDLLSAPMLPLDPSAAAAAGQQALYTQWLRDGEDTLASAVTKPSLRTLEFVAAPLSAAGGALLRDLGGRLVVITPEQYDTLPNEAGQYYRGYTDTTALVELTVGEDTTLDAVIVDRVISGTLARSTTNPTITAIYAVTDLLAVRQQIVDADGDPRHHGVALATPDLSLPAVDTFTAITTLIAATPGLRPTTFDDLGVRAEVGELNGRPVEVQLPAETDGDITRRVFIADQLTGDAAGVGSMLPLDDRRPAAWARQIGLLPTSALTDDQVTTITQGLQHEFAAITDAVELPKTFSFTLTGRSTDVPVKLRNNGNTVLNVIVRMSSSKLQNTVIEVPVQLQPQSLQEVKVPIIALTNGEFRASLQVLTPNKVQIGNAVPLNLTVAAFSGLGRLITGALLLVILTWWVRHVRQNRRKRAAAGPLGRHPAGAAGPSTRAAEGDEGDDHSPAEPAGSATADDSGLSPDAATSTLPPS